MTHARHPLDYILAPRSIAFLGASDSLFTMGTAQLHNVIQGGFEGPVYPIHPKLDTVLNHKAYKSILELPESVDLAVMVIPTRLVPEVLEQCGERGIRHATVISGGFAEVGEDGAELQRRIKSIAARYGIRFNGPNCIGVCNPGHKYNNTWFPYPGKPGPIGLASQSGTYVCHTFNYFHNLGTGLSKGVSVGNEAVLDIVDCLEYFENDEETRVIAMYIEGIRRGREFIETARRVAAKKPIVALYVGGTEAGARAGASHTAVLAGPDELYDGVFRQAGVIRAATFEELFDWSWALAQQPPLEGDRLAVITNSGGPGSSLADAANRRGFRVPTLPAEMQAKLREKLPHTGSPRNPIDITFAIDSAKLMMVDLPRMLLESDEIDGILLYGVFDAEVVHRYAEESGLKLPAGLDQMHAYEDMLAQGLARVPVDTRKPILGTSFFNRHEMRSIRVLQDMGVPFLPTPERAAGAAYALRRYAEIRRKLAKGL